MNAPEKFSGKSGDDALVSASGMDEGAASAPTGTRGGKLRLRKRGLDFSDALAAGFQISDLSREQGLSPDVKKRSALLRELSKEISKSPEDSQKAFFIALHHAIKAFTVCDSVETQDALAYGAVEFVALSKLSQKKLGVAGMKEEAGKLYDGMPSEERDAHLAAGMTRSKYVKIRTREAYNRLKIMPPDVVRDVAGAVGMGENAVRFHEAFFASENYMDTLDGLYDSYGIDAAHLEELARSYPVLRINPEKIRRVVGEDLWESTGNLAANLLSGELKGHAGKITEILDLELKDVDSNGFIDPNWLLNDISTYLGLKMYGDLKMRYVFGKYFIEAVRKLDAEHGLGLNFPNFYNLCLFRLRKRDSEAKRGDSGEKPEFSEIAQHVMEWDVPRDFSIKELKEIAASLRAAVPDLQSISSTWKDFRHPVRTVKGRTDYVGMFSGAKDFENTNLVLVRPSEKEGTWKLRLSTDLGQDQFLYMLVQVSRYLSQEGSRDTFEPKQLWTLIYRTYNALSTQNTAKFDISIFESQYEDFVKSVIWPLSLEYHEKFGKAGKGRHTALVGLYGTGKSQFLTSLLSKKEFDIRGKKLHLNANTVNMGILNLIDILSKDASDFKRRLSDIHENTKLPIILIIEDIDTIVNEKEGISDIVTQALTNLFEGVGSLPITMVTTTNYPERISDRLVRPNRIDSIISFNLPLEDKVLSSAMEAHVDKNGLRERIEKIFGSTAEFVARFAPRMKDFTASHISKFVESIQESVKYGEEFDSAFELTEEAVERLFGELLIPVEDIRFRQKCIKEWDEKHRERSGKSSMGFHANA